MQARNQEAWIANRVCEKLEAKSQKDGISLNLRTMESNPGHDFFEHINLEGKNTGAAFVIRPGSEAESHTHHCCCINIYINNNVQGANNSLLHGSFVKMRDPGVHLFFRDIKLGKSLRINKRRRKKKESPSSSEPGTFPIVLFAIFIPFLLLLSILCPWNWHASWLLYISFSSFKYWHLCIYSETIMI